MEIRIEETTAAHVRQLGDRLRPEDLREVEAFGFPTNKALWRTFKGGIMRRTVFIDGELAACWGCGGVPLSAEGRPWLLTTAVADKISPLKFVRIYQEEVFKMLQVFPKLVNWCDARYDKAMRLLDIIGFRIGEPEPLGMNGVLFRKFELSRKDGN